MLVWLGVGWRRRRVGATLGGEEALRDVREGEGEREGAVQDLRTGRWQGLGPAEGRGGERAREEGRQRTSLTVWANAAACAWRASASAYTWARASQHTCSGTLCV